MLVLLLVAVPVAGLLIYQLAGIWLGFGFRRCTKIWFLVAGGQMAPLKDSNLAK
jgi:hypothetical protein